MMRPLRLRIMPRTARLATRNVPVQVGVEHRVEVVFAHQGQQLVFVDPSVGDQDLNRAVGLLHLFESGVHLGAVGDVALNPEQSFGGLPVR